MLKVTPVVWLLSGLVLSVIGASPVSGQCSDPTLVVSSNCSGELMATLTGAEDYLDSYIVFSGPDFYQEFSGPLTAGVPFMVSQVMPFGAYLVQGQALCPNSIVSAIVSVSHNHVCDDCNANGTLDVDEFSNLLVTNFFDMGLGAWTATGLWHVSSDATCFPTPPSCDTVPVAYFGQDGVCNYDTGVAVAGDLTSPPVALPATALSARLRYCSLFDAENGTPPSGFDSAWVEVNGTIVDEVSSSVPLSTWEDRFVDLTPYLGQTVTIAFRFDSVDNFANLTLGWAVDGIIVETNDDCDQNGVLDECDPDCNGNGLVDACEILDGSALDCNGNGVPDECDITSGTSGDCNGDGLPDECGISRSSYDSVISPPLPVVPGSPAIDSISVGDPGTIFDLDVAVDIPANFIGDLVVDLMSPAATTVILHNQTGSSASGLFVTYDDDGAFGTTIPNQPLSTFDGENRFGSWTLTVTDTFSNDGGTFDAWGLLFSDPVSFADCNMNGINDSCDIETGVAEDCNANGIPDSCDLASGFSPDCDGNGVPDECEPSTLIFSQQFDTGLLPNGWGSTGLWNVTGDCATGIGCGTGPGAYFGDALACNFDTGAPESGVLFTHPIRIPNNAATAQLRYCSAYSGQGGSQSLGFGKDRAWVQISGVVVDDVSIDGDTASGETRMVDLTPFIGQTILIGFAFGSIDELDNATLGWRIDDIEVAYEADCDADGISDACEILAGAPDCDGDGVPDTCRYTAGGPPVFIESILSPPIPISNTLPPAVDTITVPDAGLIQDVNISVEIPHTFIGDLRVDLMSPAGTLILLHDQGGGGANDLIVTYDDDGAAGTVLPVEPLSTFDGESRQGPWTLTVTDLLGGDVGTLNRWDILIDRATFDDCNANGIDDACETDCDLNGVPDDCDIAGGVADCDANGVPDRCEVTTLFTEGFDTGAVPSGWTATGLWNVTESCDGTPGLCDDGPFGYFGDPTVCSYDYGTLETGSLNSPTFMIPSDSFGVFLRYCSRYEGEGGGPGSFDEASVLVNGVTVDTPSAGNGFIDTGWTTRVVDLSPFIGQTVSLEFFFDTGDSCCSNGFLGWQVDGIEVISGQDCNMNMVPDNCELDCNGSGLPDDCDIAAGTSQDCNSNGTPDECDISSGTSSDCNGNGIPDECDVAMLDCNSNGIPDDCDIAGGIAQDCNGNSIPDTCDIASGVSIDCNFNSIPDDCEIAAGIAQDCNGNGIPDTCDIGSGFSEDCNINSIPDDCDIASGLVEDCNVNGIPDLCDIGSGTSTDGNLNGVPDECEAVLFDRGDCNADGNLNIADGVFTLATLFSGGPAGPCADACDANDNGNLNIADAVFTLATLFSGGPNPPAPFGVCGTDPTADNLDCLSFSPCP